MTGGARVRSTDPRPLELLAAGIEQARRLGRDDPRRSTPGAPVFSTVRGGMSRLVDALAATLPDVRLGLPVRELRRHGTGWRLTVGSTRDASTVDADGGRGHRRRWG